MAERSLAEEWERRARDWERWTRTAGHDVYFHAFNWPSFLELLPPAGRATLDLGCGEGRAAAALRERGHRLTGLDASPTLAALASATGDYEEVRVADAVALPFADASFDLVIAFMSLQDMDDPGAAVREAARVLSPGGRLAAAIVHPFASATPPDAEPRPYFDVMRTVDEMERDGIAFAFHQLHRPLEGWIRLLLDAGLTVEDVREPRPSAEAVAAAPPLARARDRPVFLHLRCSKP